MVSMETDLASKVNKGVPRAVGANPQGKAFVGMLEIQLISGIWLYLASSRSLWV